MIKLSDKQKKKKKGRLASYLAEGRWILGGGGTPLSLASKPLTGHLELARVPGVPLTIPYT